MSATVKLSSKLPGDPEINGLDAWAQQLLDEPEDLVVAVVYLDVRNIVESIDEGTRVPVVRVRRVEPLGNIPDVAKAVRDAVAKAEEARTGRKAIPFEIVEVGEHAFGDPLPAGGE